MLDLVKITEDLKAKFDKEVEASVQKVMQLQGFMAGMNKAKELANEYVKQISAQAQQELAKAKAEAEKKAPAEVKKAEDGPNKD